MIIINFNDYIQKLETYCYWDARIVDISIATFFNNIDMYLELNDNEYLQLSFIQCYNIKFEHYFEYQKNIDYCKLKKQQIPYFIQNIEGEDLNIYDYIKYHIKIDMFPGVLELYCNSLNVKKVSGFVLGIE